MARRLGRGDTVIVRIDQLKDLDADKVRMAHAAGDRWYVCKRNELDALLIRHNALEMIPADLTDGAEYHEVFLCGSEGDGGAASTTLLA